MTISKLDSKQGNVKLYGLKKGNSITILNNKKDNLTTFLVQQ